MMEFHQHRDRVAAGGPRCIVTLVEGHLQTKKRSEE